jgi:hypothetical protein
MAREAALSARLKLDDSDVQKKIRAQNTHYQALISQNKRYKDRIASDNEAARKKEDIREQLAARKQAARDREKFERWKAQNAAATAEKVKRWKKEQELETVLQSHPAAQRLAGSRVLNAPTSSTAKGGKGAAAGGGASNSGMAMLMFSQGLEDAQYGLKGVLNNIPPLVMAMGGSAGLAGAISITAVGVTQLTKVMAQLNKEEELAAGNAARLAQYTKTTARAINDAEDAGRKQAAAINQQFELMDQKREYDQRELTRQEKLAAAQRDLQQAEVERLTGSARLRAEHELASKGERTRLAAEEAAAQRQAEVDGKKLADIRTRQQSALAMLAEYEAMKTEAEKTAARGNNEIDNAAANKMRQRRESFVYRFGEGMGNMVGSDLAKNLRDSMGSAATAWSPKDEAALQQLKAFTDANAANVNTADTRARASAGNAADVAVDRQALDLSDKAAQIRIANEEGKEFNETLRKNFEQGAEFGQLVGKVFKKLTGDFGDLLRKTREQAQAKNSFEGNLQVQELRGKGKHRAADRLEKKMFLENRPAQLQKEFNMNPADAASAAQREWDIQHPDRAGTIRGAKSQPTVNGLDWLKNKDRNPGKLTPRNDEPSALDWVNGRGVGKAKGAAAPAMPAASAQDPNQWLRSIYEVLKEKLNPPGPVANQLKPVNAP